MLTDGLRSAIRRINPEVPPNAQLDALKEVQHIHSPDLTTNNKAFHKLLTEGIPVAKRVDGEDRGDIVWLVDFEQPNNNEFLVANQFTVIENNKNKRPDIILFIKGLPPIVIELKNAADENATVKSAFKQ